MVRNALAPIGLCLFLAGITRMETLGAGRTDTRVGIHRPYLTDTSLTTGQVQKAALIVSRISLDMTTSASDIEAKVRAYFHEMNISQRLVDDMMVIPSDQVRWLSAYDIDLYGLLGSDPVIDEARILAGAKQLGISRAEFEGREERFALSMMFPPKADVSRENSCLDPLPCYFRSVLKDIRKLQCRSRGGCQ
jgi:hypothetical protein